MKKLLTIPLVVSSFLGSAAFLNTESASASTYNYQNSYSNYQNQENFTILNESRGAAIYKFVGYENYFGYYNKLVHFRTDKNLESRKIIGEGNLNWDTLSFLKSKLSIEHTSSYEKAYTVQTELSVNPNKSTALATFAPYQPITLTLQDNRTKQISNVTIHRLVSYLGLTSAPVVENSPLHRAIMSNPENIEWFTVTRNQYM
ncbi:hypothetical protein [Bacillus cereus]|uniref:hypothetical protein n=1 Tax=Bacillus cereus TaxID=1396 RepID=UPI000C285D75|nr:hypothetical protein [Bacillus cereus]